MKLADWFAWAPLCSHGSADIAKCRRVAEAALNDRLVPTYRVRSRLQPATSGISADIARGFAEIAGIDPHSVFRQEPHGELERELYALALAVQEPRIHADWQAVYAWARELGLERWFDWIPLDESR